MTMPWLNPLDRLTRRAVSRPATGDLTLDALATAVARELMEPEVKSLHELDDFIAAVILWVARSGVAKDGRPPKKASGLTRTQEQRAREMLANQLHLGLPIEQVAHACGLSRGHFTKAFKQTTGVSPHAWRTARRIEAAKSLLRDAAISLVDIALNCGFTDQAHFTRAFGQATGSSPGSWRRERQS